MVQAGKDSAKLRQLIKTYLKTVEKKSKTLASAIGLGNTTLSNKLNETDQAKFNEADIKRILTVLIEWQAITTRSQVLELLIVAGAASLWQTLDWHNSLFQQLKADIATSAPAQQPPRLEELTTLVGRQAELNEIWQLLRIPQTRLLTLTGVGGIGKTRLARQLFNQFNAWSEILGIETVFWVELASLTDYRLVPNVVAQSLGLKETTIQTVTESIKNYLRDKPALLILDNFEQVIEAGIYLTDILRTTSRLKMVITSREALCVYGEYQYQINPLAVPDLKKLPASAMSGLDDLPALALFVSRAQAIKPDFELNQENIRAIAEICIRLDGLPLAIELAAVRVRVFTPPKLLERLSLQLLAGGSRDLPARQQTLTKTLDWSYDLLTPPEQQLFRQLAIFVAGCNLETAESVCEGVDVLAGLESLIVKNLLIQGQPAPGDLRYSMLQTVREYGLQKLEAAGETSQLTEKYITYYLSWVREWTKGLRSTAQVEVFEKFDSEYNNLLAILNQLILTRDATRGLQLSAALWRYWQTRAYWNTGSHYLEQVLSLNGGLNQDRAACLIRLGCIRHFQGDYIIAIQNLEQGLALSRSVGDKVNIAFALNELGTIAAYNAKRNEAQSCYQESLVLRRELNDQRGMAVTLNNLGNIAYEQGNYRQAQQYYEESLVIKQLIGDKRSISLSLNNLGNIAYEQGDYKQAQQYYQESLSIKQAINDKSGLVLCFNTLGNLAYQQAGYQQAHQYYQQGLSIAQEIGDKRGISLSLVNLGSLETRQANYGQARQYYQESLQLAQKINDPTLQVNIQVGIIYLLAKFRPKTELETLKVAATWLGTIAHWLTTNQIQLEAMRRVFYEQASQILEAELGSSDYAAVFAAGQANLLEQVVEQTLAFTKKIS